MQINIEVLKAHNAFDKSIETVRDVELSILKENRYRLTDLEYNCQYELIYNKFERKMYRTWNNKNLVIIK